jgi:non-specific serine/threonine protein kinase
VPLTSFVGRERELAVIGACLRDPAVRLLTLTGPGGVGKTRLAVEAAAGLAAAAAGPVRFVALAPVRDPALVGPAIAQALGLREDGATPLAEALTARLREGPSVLVLDNFEHLLDAAPLVADLLVACPPLRVLVTSRALLRVGAERALPVAPLGLPPAAPGGAAPDAGRPAAALARYDAVRLFTERARLVSPDFALTPATAAAVAELCRRLDGLPLALELAAARVRHLPPAALLARLESPAGGLPLLTGGTRDAPARHRTLRDAIAWSYGLLPPGERALFRRLGVFAGGFTLEAAEAVAADGEPAAAVLDGLAALIDASLVGPPVEGMAGVEGDAGGARYGPLETVREFALERLEQSGEAAAVRRRHAAYFLALAERAAPHLPLPDLPDRAAEPGWAAEPGGAQEAVWLDRLEVEHANLRAALAWGEERARAGEAGPGLRLAGALWGFWYLRGHWGEGRAWLERLLAWRDAAPPAARARALYGAGFAPWSRGEYDRAGERVEELRALCRELGDGAGEASAVCSLGYLASHRGDSEAVLALAREGLALARAAGARRATAWSLALLSVAARRARDVERAAALAAEGLTLFRELGDSLGFTEALYLLGNLARSRGDYAQAAAHFEAVLAVHRAAGRKLETAASLHNLGRVALLQDDPRRAAPLFAESLALFRELDGRQGVGLCVAGLAGVAGATGQWKRAARLLGAARTLFSSPGRPPGGVDWDEYDRAVAATRAHLGAPAFAAAGAVGQAMTLEQAIADALVADAPAAAARAARDASRGPLTRREQEVAALVAQGLTNRQIAARLVVTERTAGTHLERIMNKLGAHSRAEVAAWAAEHRLAGAGAGVAAEGAG